jgi:hypothetical protein
MADRAARMAVSLVAALLPAGCGSGSYPTAATRLTPDAQAGGPAVRHDGVVAMPSEPRTIVWSLMYQGATPRPPRSSTGTREEIARPEAHCLGSLGWLGKRARLRSGIGEGEVGPDDRA